MGMGQGAGSADPHSLGYWDFVVTKASEEAFNRSPEPSLDDHQGNLSTETSPEHSALIDFKSFARDCPEKFFTLLGTLRPDLAEILIEYYVVGKSQSFLARCRKQIQARAFEILRLAEQALGALILLGPEPSRETIRPILERAGVENTEYGPLSAMIVVYADSRDYAAIARVCKAPLPAIRKILRPATAQLLASKNLYETAVGAYLRSLTHQASLTKAGFGKRHRARMQRVKHLHFEAPSIEHNPLLSYGRVDSLQDTAWCLFETSAEKKMDQFFPVLQQQAKRIFGRRAGQIFAPTNKDGELTFGYFFARSSTAALTKSLTRIRGVTEISATYTDTGTIKRLTTVPNADVLQMIAEHGQQKGQQLRIGDFVRILSGEAKGYCGTITARNIAVVKFLSGRTFTVRLAAGSAKVLDVPEDSRAFWGELSI